MHRIIVGIFAAMLSINAYAEDGASVITNSASANISQADIEKAFEITSQHLPEYQAFQKGKDVSHGETKILKERLAEERAARDAAAAVLRERETKLEATSTRLMEIKLKEAGMEEQKEGDETVIWLRKPAYWKLKENINALLKGVPADIEVSMPKEIRLIKFAKPDAFDAFAIYGNIGNKAFEKSMYSGDGNEHATAIIYIEEFRNAYDKYVRIQITMSCNLIGGIMDWDSVVPTGVIQLNQVIPEASESDNRVAKTIFERKLTFERQP